MGTELWPRKNRVFGWEGRLGFTRGDYRLPWYISTGKNWRYQKRIVKPSLSWLLGGDSSAQACRANVSNELLFTTPCKAQKCTRRKGHERKVTPIMTPENEGEGEWRLSPIASILFPLFSLPLPLSQNNMLLRNGSADNFERISLINSHRPVKPR